MGITDWAEYRETLNLTTEDEAEIQFEKDIILAIAKTRGEQGASRKRAVGGYGRPQSAIARLEKAVRSPQISTLIRGLAPLGYTLKVVPREDAAGVCRIPGNRKTGQEKHVKKS